MSTSTFQALAVVPHTLRESLDNPMGPIFFQFCSKQEVAPLLKTPFPLERPGWVFAAGSMDSEELVQLLEESATASPQTLRVILGSLSGEIADQDFPTSRLLELADGWIPWPVTASEFLFRLGMIQRTRLGGLGSVVYSLDAKDELILKLRQETEELKASLTRCSLTGLLNRKGIEDKLEAECARRDRYASPISLLMIDVDHFKKINDQYLHTGGDAVLSQLGTHFRSQVRNVDAVGRLGGEEFWVVAPGTDTAGATVLANRLGSSTRDQGFQIGNRTIRLSISIGVAVAETGQSAEPTQLYELAASALREAKNQGRDAVVARQLLSD